tara:strand:- start:1212 stop:3404 length:2193 start_codon:yes stop_codon:yes gene_type:complete
MLINALNNLNENQNEAVKHIDGPALIIAGPGSGKTRVITSRIAWLVQNNISIHQIAALTFTNKAASEMKERIFKILDSNPVKYLPNIGTFHSFCAYLLRENSELLTVDKNFLIYDNYDQISVIKRVLNDLNLDVKIYKPQMILGLISKSKSQLETVEEFGKNISTAFNKNVYEIYKNYQEKLTQSNAMDFDDLLVNAYFLLKTNINLLLSYNEKYKYLMIDEFQDTNFVQYKIARLLSNEHKNIFVVGDPDQSIYSWRNADITNILNFKTDYPNTNVIYLNQNYRSSQNIIDASQSVISENQNKYDRKIFSAQNSEGNLIVTVESYDEIEEAEKIAGEVHKIIKSNEIKLSDIAVMYRTNAQSRAFEQVFSLNQIPFQLVGGTRFYQRQEIKDLLAYIRLILNSNDDSSFLRVINIPTRGIGKSTVDKITQNAYMNSLSCLESAKSLANNQSNNEINLSTGPSKNINMFLDILNNLQIKSENSEIDELIAEIIQTTKYRDYIISNLSNPEERLENIEELISSITNFDAIDPKNKINEFLESVSLINDVDSIQDDTERLTLITLHQSKGLEYDTVFLTGLEDGTLPHILSFDNDMEMEEERRLLYVGITRAKQRLYLSRVFKRGGWGKSEVKSPSRFLYDIPDSLVVGHNVNKPDKNSPKSSFKRYSNIKNTDVKKKPEINAGEKVKHPTYGEGIVISAVNSTDDIELTIAFDQNKGIKKFLYSMSGIIKI